MTHDAYWHLPAEERKRREAQFHSLPRSWAREDGGGLVAYEALQPPLYYWVRLRSCVLQVTWTWD